MSKMAISIHNLSKEYLITKGKKKEVFKALDNINLQIEEGKVTGLIGPNGAGKSTLLKILSRITYPTKGEVKINGRLASLLEVGTGFHPELSGRENIFLNGAVLGMSRSEIQKQFDEIVNFSGIEEFLDTPVKHYSSGMYVRLAFSVAAHLRSEILLVDEVLAVGDSEFQKKCLGKMNETTREIGRSIVFVSHNLGAIRELCHDVVWLSQGKVKQMGTSDDICNAYLSSLKSFAVHTPIHTRKDRQGKGNVRIKDIQWQSDNGNILIAGKDAKLVVKFEAESAMAEDLHIRLNIVSSQGVFLTTLSNVYSGFPVNGVSGNGQMTCHLPSLNLLRGNYSIMASLFANGELQDRVREAILFEVQEGDFFNSGKINLRNKEGVETPQSWTIK